MKKPAFKFLLDGSLLPLAAAPAASTLAGRIRWVLYAFDLTHKDLAEVMEIKVDRVKSLVLGRVKELRRAEIQRLKRKYKLNDCWLVGEQQSTGAAK